jgi:23S rRNA pseudouridine2604 synthase
MAEEPVRLAKRVAALVPCSRREAELYIAGGWVRVDGVVIEEPQYRVTDQRIEVDPAAATASYEPATFLVHKPAGATDAQALQLLGEANRFAGDASGIRFAKRQLADLRPLMSLPPPASGLSVFSQARGVIRKLTEDANVIEQELIAEVSGAIAPGGLALLCHGLVLEGRALPPIKVSWQNETRLRFALKGIAPATLPWMCGQVGLRVEGLKRIRLGRLPMAGLAPSQWRLLQGSERF